MCWGGVGRQIAVVAVALFFASTAIAQIIPPSEQLGRERERFTQPPLPQAQPGPGATPLGSEIAPGPGYAALRRPVDRYQIIRPVVGP